MSRRPWPPFALVGSLAAALALAGPVRAEDAKPSRAKDAPPAREPVREPVQKAPTGARPGDGQSGGARSVRFAPESLRPPAPPSGPQAVRVAAHPDGEQPRELADPLAQPDMNPLQGPAALAVARVRITIRAIAATRTAPGEPAADAAPERLEIDGRLVAIDKDLRAFAAQFTYRGYRLMDEQTFDLDFQSPGTMDLPGGRALRVEPLRLVQDGRVQVRLQVTGQEAQGAQRLATDYSIPKGRTLLVGGYHVSPGRPELGTLLIAITQGAR